MCKMCKPVLHSDWLLRCIVAAPESPVSSAVFMIVSILVNKLDRCCEVEIIYSVFFNWENNYPRKFVQKGSLLWSCKLKAFIGQTKNSLVMQT